MIYELDPVEAISIAAVGEPGHRQFFLMASGRGRTLTLACEKAQIQALIVRLHQMMDAQGIEVEGQAASGRRLKPGEPEWQVAEMGLGYHAERQMFVLVASEAAGTAESSGEESSGAEASGGDDPPSVRFWLSHRQVADFSKQAEEVLSAGRPLCPRCGLPIDPAGHPCPVSNGARPIF